MAIDDTSQLTTELVIPVGEREATVAVPETATREECAALVAAVGAHLTDHARAAAATDDASPEADRWKLAGRLGTQRTKRLPRSVKRGEEWKAAARTW